MGWVVHVLLEGAIEVGEGLGATGEPETLAKVVTTLGAEATVVAHDAGLDSHSLTDHEVLNTRTNRGYDAGGFVTEDHGGLEGKVAIPAVDIIMDWRIGERLRARERGRAGTYDRFHGDDLNLVMVEVQTVKHGAAETAAAEATRATREERREEENIVETFEETTVRRP